MIDIKSLFKKAERGTRKGKVKVTRGGKTFYREQMVGRKEEEKSGVATARKQIELIDKEISRKKKIQKELPKNSDDWNKVDKEIDKLIDRKSDLFLHPKTTIR